VASCAISSNDDANIILLRGVSDKRKRGFFYSLNAHANRAPRRKAAREPDSAAVGRSGSACCWAALAVSRNRFVQLTVHPQ
jgi:hypothetical protein